MSSLVGRKVRLTITGRGGEFNIKYRYDPNYSLIDRTISNDGVQPINSSVIAKNFLTCYVYEIHIDYRKKSAQNVDLLKAKEEIVTYVNNLTYPYSYEEYTVAEILLFYGAEGVQKIKQKGQFFRSLANKYMLLEDDKYTLSDIENPYSLTLEPPSDVAGLGKRNVNYILDASNVKFNAILV